jgi:murein DD-endopeptidase MepM/ murein hydrolase activator NlpD
LASPEAAARVLKKYYDRYQDWALAAIAYRFGEAAADRLASGTATPQERALYARQVGKWYTYLSKEGLGFNDVFSSPREVASGAFGGVGGGGGGTSVSLLDYPDWSNVRQFAEQTIKSLYFRDPHPGEVEALVGMVKGAIDSENARRQAAAGGGGTGDGTFTPGVAGGIVFPVQGGAKYGNDWHAPRDGGRRLHKGIDLVAPQGTPAVAAVSGTIITAGNDGGIGGNRVWIKGDDGRYYYYAHLDKITVTVGQHVTAGEQVGTVGTTGNAKGGTPHLHFAISVTNPRTQGESYINPYPILKGAPQAAAVSGGNAPQTFNDVSPEARIIEQLRGTPEYQRLYAKKPSYLSEADYAKQFIGAGQELLGKAPGNEAVRVGLETGSLGTTVGYVSGGQEALQSGSFIGRLFAAAEVFNRLL